MGRDDGSGEPPLPDSFQGKKEDAEFLLHAVGVDVWCVRDLTRVAMGATEISPYGIEEAFLRRKADGSLREPGATGWDKTWPDAEWIWPEGTWYCALCGHVNCNWTPQADKCEGFKRTKDNENLPKVDCQGLGSKTVGLWLRDPAQGRTASEVIPCTHEPPVAHALRRGYAERKLTRIIESFCRTYGWM